MSTLQNVTKTGKKLIKQRIKLIDARTFKAISSNPNSKYHNRVGEYTSNSNQLTLNFFKL